MLPSKPRHWWKAPRRPLRQKRNATSISLAYQAAEDINEIHDDRVVVVFYIGDHDPAGVHIDVALERELRQHLNPAVDLLFRRLAITPQQIATYDLPTKPRKTKDKRALHIAETVEAEAMPAGVMRRMLRDHIEALLPSGALEIAKAAEESERAQLLAFAEVAGRQ